MAMRPLDIVLYGATGFTGGLAAEYLARNVSGLRWALAGRDRTKLESVATRLGIDIPIIVADAHDFSALSALARRTEVVATAAGPFALYGDELVAACVEHGTHYCDLSGETQWIARMIEQHQDCARRSGARIVHACGYDSLPSDLGVFALQKHAIEAFGEPCGTVSALVRVTAPSLSGGTFASIFRVAEEARHNREVRRLMLDPHGLANDPRRLTGKKYEQRGVRFSKDREVYTAPLLMAPGNVRIVHRSNSLLEHMYGRDFVYEEVLSTGKGIRGALAAGAVTAGTNALLVGAAVQPLRSILWRVLPKPGTGPSDEERQGASFALDFSGSVRGKTVRARFAANGDPGYGETAKMLGESALCLASEELASSGGVLTGSSAMGDALIGRLKRKDVEISAWTQC